MQVVPANRKGCSWALAVPENIKMAPTMASRLIRFSDSFIQAVVWIILIVVRVIEIRYYLDALTLLQCDMLLIGASVMLEMPLPTFAVAFTSFAFRRHDR